MIHRVPRLVTIAVLASGIATSCAIPGEDAASSGPAIRDSLGVRIVENRGPRLPAGTWRLSADPVVEIRGDGPAVDQIPLDPVSVFGGPRGEIFVGDGNQVGWHAVLVYDSTGAFVRRMGGRGQGPGELAGQLWSAVPYRGDSVVAWDLRGPTLHVYGADGGFGRRVLLPELPVVTPEGTTGFTSGFVGAFPDGSFLSFPRGALEIPADPGPAWYRHLLLEVAPGGERFDTVGDFRFAQYSFWDGSEQRQMAIPHTGYELTYGDELIYGSSLSYEYSVLGRDGAPRLIVRRSVTPEPVSREDVEAVVSSVVAGAASSGRMSDEQLAQMRLGLEAAPAPATMPVYSSILADAEGNVWVERYRWFDPRRLPPDPGPSTWDVFSPEGEWITELAVPARVVLRSVSQGRAFGVRIDEMEVKHVVVYGIERDAR